MNTTMDLQKGQRGRRLLGLWNGQVESYKSCQDISWDLSTGLRMGKNRPARGSRHRGGQLRVHGLGASACRARTGKIRAVIPLGHPTGTASMELMRQQLKLWKHQIMCSNLDTRALWGNNFTYNCVSWANVNKVLKNLYTAMGQKLGRYFED